MLSYPHLSTDGIARALSLHHAAVSKEHMRALFAAEPERFARFSAQACGLFLDYSKNRVTAETLGLLLELAGAVELSSRIEQMYSGERINKTEGRAVLHVALRHSGPSPFPGASFDVMDEVRDVLRRMADFAAAVRVGTWTGFSGEPIESVVNIGIGGSDLGPAMAAEALDAYRHPRLVGHYVSSLDSTELHAVLRRCNPQTTLFIVASKTFSTQETLSNAHSARRWLLEAAGGDTDAIARHFVAISTQLDRTAEFGIGAENVFAFWDWVGGRYSLWSAIGLSLMVLIGKEPFEELLAGAHDMDRHFADAPYERNLPVLMGLLGVWYRNFFAAATHVVLPYDYALRRFPDYLQQLEMESNGKRALLGGGFAPHDTCPVVWGGSGNNGQHAFYQLLHQGTQLIPADFIVPLELQHPLPGHEDALISNALAQTEALMRGRTAAEARAELRAQGLEGEALDAAVAHRVMPGNRPSNTIVYQKLDPRTLGALIALYEHKVFVQSVCWGINAFDQWGVELGKLLAKRIEPELAPGRALSAHDGSTLGLIELARARRSTPA